MYTYDHHDAGAARHVVPVCSVVHAQQLISHREQLLHARENGKGDVLYSRDLLFTRIRNVGCKRLASRSPEVRLVPHNISRL